MYIRLEIGGGVVMVTVKLFGTLGVGPKVVKVLDL